MDKESTLNVGGRGDKDLILGSGRSPGGGNDNHSSNLVWKTPWTEEPGRYIPRVTRVGYDRTHGTHCINRLKKKNHVVLSIDSEKAFNKIPSFFMIKTLSKLEIERHSNLINNICKTPTASIILNGEKFPTKTRLKARISPITTAFQHCIESLD